MSDPRTDSTGHRTAEAASGTAHGRHRGPASDDTAPAQAAQASGHGRHRRPSQPQEANAG
jgi:hypothetical protein